jgi:acyl carrier protein
MTEIERQVLTVLGEQFEREPELDEPLASLGIDSLGMAELTVEMEERFGVRVDEYILGIETARELAAYIEKLRNLH